MLMHARALDIPPLRCTHQVHHIIIVRTYAGVPLTECSSSCFLLGMSLRSDKEMANNSRWTLWPAQASYGQQVEKELDLKRLHYLQSDMEN